MRPLRPLAIIHTNRTLGFKAPVNDQVLHQHLITLELRNAKNLNKNPVADKAVQEFESERLRQDPWGETTSHITLAIATATLNSRIHSRRLSSWEMWTQQDRFYNSQIPLKGHDIIANQHEQRILNHPHSEYSRAPLAQTKTSPLVEVVDLVYLHSDRKKSCAGDRYLVVPINGPFCNIKKFNRSELPSSSYRVKTSECFKISA